MTDTTPVPSREAVDEVCKDLELEQQVTLLARAAAIENAKNMLRALLAEVERLTGVIEIVEGDRAATYRSREELRTTVAQLERTVADQAAALAERDKDAEHIRQAIDEQFTRYSDLYDTSVKRGKANAHTYKIVVDAIQWIADRTAALAASVSSASEDKP